MTDLEELKKQLQQENAALKESIPEIASDATEHALKGAESKIVSMMEQAVNVALAKQAEYIQGLQRELEEARRDADLFTWWFSDSNKGNFLLRYMEGMKERWSVERWRTEINAARQQKG